MKFPIALCAVAALSGCMQMQLSGILDTSATEENLRPPNAEPGACYGREVAPAVVETVTEHVQVRAATYDTAGTLLTPAGYRTETVQKIVQERADIWFKTPCRDVRVNDFTASLQRALKVRGYFIGPVTGEMDWSTRRAVRRYQQVQGLDSATLSLASARQLGLAPVERDPKPDADQ